MKPGPPKKPTALKLIRGETRPSRINAAEPKPPPIMPARPDAISPEAAQVWDALAPDLHRHGVLTAWDGALFGAFCEATVQNARALELIGPALLVRGRKDGTLVTNPAWRIYRDSAHLMRTLGAEFGLTPAARAGLRTPEVDASESAALFTPIRAH